MLRTATDIEQFELRTGDETIGRVQDFFFDDHRWQVRYFVVGTRSEPVRKVLISPAVISTPDWMLRIIPVALTRTQVEQSPPLDPEQPVSREHETALAHHYNWPVYWGVAGFPELAVDDGAAGSAPKTFPAVAGKPEPDFAPSTASPPAPGDRHLHSVRAVIGSDVEAADGGAGQVADILMDDLTWEVRYLLVDTGKWWPGKKVLIAPQWIERFEWSTRKVRVKLGREAIKESPAYDAKEPITPDYPGQLRALRRDQEGAVARENPP